MKSFSELESLDIHWESNSWGTKHELKDSDGETIALMRRNSWRDSATVEAVGNHWRFQSRGFWKRRIEIVSVGMDEHYGTYHYNGNTLTLNDGREFHWKQANFWGSKWVWMDAANDPVIGFQTGGMLRFKSDVLIDQDNADDKALPLLTFLGWLLIYKQREQAAAVAASV